MSQFRGQLLEPLRTASLLLLGLVASTGPLRAEPITYAVRGSTGVSIGHLTGAEPPADPIEVTEDRVSIDEVYDQRDLSLFSSSVTGSGATDGYAGTAQARIIDGVLGAYASATFAGSGDTGISSGSGVGFIDYFTVQLPEGSFVPMLFTLVPSYTISASGGCGHAVAGVQVGLEEAWSTSLLFIDSLCSSDSLATTAVFMVPTGVPFRVLYELSVAAFSPSFTQAGGVTVDALSSLHIFADPLGDFTYSSASGLNRLSPASVPEPASLLLLGAGLATLGLHHRTPTRRRH